MNIPDPYLFGDWRQWVDRLRAEAQVVDEEVIPSTPLLQTANADSRLAEGLLLNNITFESPVSGRSDTTRWLPLADRSTELHYLLGSGVAGATIGATSNIVPFTNIRQDRTWITFNSGTGTFQLEEGTYYLHGFCTLYPTTTAANNATFILANSTLLTTRLTGAFQSAPFTYPASGQQSNYFVPFQGFLRHTDDTINVALSCLVTTASTLSYGIANNLTTYETYAKLRIQPLEITP